MWGNILTELSYIQNFNTRISCSNVNMFMYLTHSQYWCWFWFIFLWTLYFLLIAHVFRYRTIKFSPNIFFTLKLYDNWVDLLICVIPAFLCLSALINFNFLLKFLTKQDEYYLSAPEFHSKEWYHLNKLDLCIVYNKHVNTDDYLHIIHIRSNNNWSKNYWLQISEKNLFKKTFRVQIRPKQEIETNSRYLNWLSCREDFLYILNPRYPLKPDGSDWTEAELLKFKKEGQNLIVVYTYVNIFSVYCVILIYLVDFLEKYLEE